MKSINLNQLIKKLNKAASSSLEIAVNLCGTHTHYTIEIEHWLLALMNDSSSEFMLCLMHFHVNTEQLRLDLETALAHFKSGNLHTPSFSPNLIEWLQCAWSFVSLELNCQQIGTSALLHTLLSNSFLSRFAYNASHEFKKINCVEMLANLETILEKANEDYISDLTPTIDNQQKALTEFTVDLTEQARLGNIDPVIGRNNEIRMMMDILMRRRQNNPILLGEAGVGKTAVVEGLALRIASQDVPSELFNIRILLLDLGLLQAGASVKGEFEKRLQMIIKTVKQSVYPVILFIDEAHNLIGAGNQPGQGDAANLLKPALARGEIRTIAATTWPEYKKYFEKDAALSRRFQAIKINEPDEATSIAILRGLIRTLETHHQVSILDEAVLASVRLSKRYLPAQQLPDKAISLLDTACARVKLSQSTLPEKLAHYQQQLQQIKDTKALLKREQNLGKPHHSLLKKLTQTEKNLHTQYLELSTRWEKEKNSVEHIKNIQSQLENTESLSQAKHKQLLKKLNYHQKQLEENEQQLVYDAVNASMIAKVISLWTGIPTGKMLNNEIDQLLHLEHALNQRIIGQAHAMQIIAHTVYTARAHLTNPKKPIGIFLLLGSSGIGKTETAFALTELLHGTTENLTIINMSELKEEHKISMLTGSPAGYVGYGEGGMLTEAIKRHPYSVILLDEIEKAHHGIQDIFYQAFDKGILFDGEGNEIDFRNTIILMTANVGADIILKNPDISIADLQDYLQSELLSVFKAAFLSRVTVVPYFPLSKIELQKIVVQQLKQIEERLQQHYEANFSYDQILIDYILQASESTEGGARNIQRFITNQLLPQISLEILNNIRKKNKIKLVSIRLVENQKLMIAIHS